MKVSISHPTRQSTHKRSRLKTRQAWLTGLLIIVTSLPADAGNDAVSSWTLDAGGSQLATGGPWSLSGTIGQWDSQPPTTSSTDGWVLTGGFWQQAAHASDPEPTGPLIFRDSFERNPTAGIMGSE